MIDYAHSHADASCLAGSCYGVTNLPPLCLMLQESIQQFVLSIVHAAAKQRQYVCTAKFEVLVRVLCSAPVYVTFQLYVSTMLR